MRSQKFADAAPCLRGLTVQPELHHHRHNADTGHFSRDRDSPSQQQPAWPATKTGGRQLLRRRRNNNITNPDEAIMRADADGGATTSRCHHKATRQCPQRVSERRQPTPRRTALRWWWFALVSHIRVRKSVQATPLRRVPHTAAAGFGNIVRSPMPVRNPNSFAFY